MNRFSATTESEAVLAADRSSIWAALTDPVLLPRLTPLLRHIEADGDLWRWEMARIPVLGIGIHPTFTERMSFDPIQRIDYSHEPPRDAAERVGANGWYVLSDTAGGTHLSISLTVHVDLPLALAARPAVSRVMRSVIGRTGDRFSHNLERHLGLR